jgi:hypothetical protein
MERIKSNNTLNLFSSLNVQVRAPGLFGTSGRDFDSPAALAVVAYRKHSTQPTSALSAFIAYARGDFARESMLPSNVCVTVPVNTLGEFRVVGR